MPNNDVGVKNSDCIMMLRITPFSSKTLENLYHFFFVVLLAAAWAAAAWAAAAWAAAA